MQGAGRQLAEEGDEGEHGLAAGWHKTGLSCQLIWQQLGNKTIKDDMYPGMRKN